MLVRGRLLERSLSAHQDGSPVAGHADKMNSRRRERIIRLIGMWF
jgi:hypothetical protein